MTTTPAPSHDQPADDFAPTEELVRRQRIQPIVSADALASSDPFESDDEHAEFLADLYRSRRAGTA